MHLYNIITATMEIDDIVGKSTTNKSDAEYNTEIIFEDNKVLDNIKKDELQNGSQALVFLAGGEEKRPSK